MGGREGLHLGGRCRCRVFWLWGCAITIAALLVFVLSPSAVSAESPDSAATHAYLMARYVLVQAELASAPPSRAAVEQLAGQIGGECPGVLRGAPPEPAPGTPFARQVGESKREDEQLAELENELSGTLGLASLQADRQALVVFAGTLRRLRWGNPAITEQVVAEAAEVEEQLALPIPGVCADMRAWVTSGYKTLSPATRALREQQEHRPSIRRRPSRPLALLLAPYEGRSEKALITKTRKLQERFIKSRAAIDSVESQLAATLGIARTETSSSRHQPGAVVVGKGKTATGGKYEVVLEPNVQSSRRRGSECAPDHPVSVSIISDEGGSSGCYSPADTHSPANLNCSEGLWTIEAQTLPAATNVRLRLSNGRQITSRVALVPPQLGGPIGLYYQVVRGPSPVPSSLTELDAAGKPLRVSKLHPFRGCTKHLLKFLPGGIRPLARGRVPNGGPAFTIVGEAFRFLGRLQFALKVEINNGFGGGGGESPSGKRPSVFSWATFRGCQPHPYVILYGLLKQTTDTVLARTGAALQPLRRAAIPAHLHAGGLLVYLASPRAPDELLLRDRAGKTVLLEKLGALGKDALETCQAESEGAAGGAVRG